MGRYATNVFKSKAKTAIQAKKQVKFYNFNKKQVKNKVLLNEIMNLFQFKVDIPRFIKMHGYWQKGITIIRKIIIIEKKVQKKYRKLFVFIVLLYRYNKHIIECLKIKKSVE